MTANKPKPESRINLPTRRREQFQWMFLYQNDDYRGCPVCTRMTYKDGDEKWCDCGWTSGMPEVMLDDKRRLIETRQ